MLPDRSSIWVFMGERLDLDRHERRTRSRVTETIDKFTGELVDVFKGFSELA